jgi:hypothetical protein
MALQARLVPSGLRRQVVRVAPAALVDRARSVLDGHTRPQLALRGARVALSRRRLVHDALLHGRPPGFVATVLGGRAVLAKVVTSLRSADVWAEQASRVADALDAHGVDHVFVSVDPYRRRVIAVPDTQRDRALAALAADLGPTATQLAPVYGRDLRRPRSVSGRRPVLAGTIRVFQVLANATGVPVGGAELGCDVQLWREVEAGRPLTSNGEPLPVGALVGERTLEPVPEVIHPGPEGVVVREVDGRPRRVAVQVAEPHLQQVLDPVDVVYTWVDGSDPAWRARRDAALAGSDGLHDLAANESRYASHDELRFSLRSLEMYAPWVRHVHLVTDRQVPSWLAREHPRLSVVDHRELFGGRGRLPTFNSHAIETQLHHISGLSETYLYLNDDVFFGRPVDPGLFVGGNGVGRVFFSSVKLGPGPVRPTDLPITSAGKNNRDLLLEKFGRTTLHKFQHAPYVLNRSVMRELEDLFGSEIARTASAPFRSPTDLSVSASLGLAYGYLVGKAVPGRLRYLYADIAKSDTPARLALLLERRDHDVFCLNDHDSSRLSAESQRTVVRSFLDAYFPLPSSFER